jgi:hypothetical protein
LHAFQLSEIKVVFVVSLDLSAKHFDALHEVHFMTWKINYTRKAIQSNNFLPRNPQKRRKKLKLNSMLSEL